MALFDGYDDQQMREHAAAHPDTAPLLLDFSHREAFVATVHGMPVGQIKWTFEQDEDVYSDDDQVALAAKGDLNGYYLRIDTLAVDEAFRRRGIGTLLLEKFIAYAERHHGPEGWDPGRFTADGAAFWKAARGEGVEVTERISFG